MNSLFLKLTLTVTAFLMATVMAYAALSVNSAKQQGLVGERPDGLLGIVSAANPEVKSLVATTNAERLSRYNDIASKNGTAVDQVQALAGKKLIEGAPSGEFVLNAAGSWQKK